METNSWNSENIQKVVDELRIQNESLRARVAELEGDIELDDSPRPCLLCEKEMRPVTDNWKTMQPSNGGEVRFVFSWGSQFDECFGVTEYRALVCDDCASRYLERMQRVDHG